MPGSLPLYEAKAELFRTLGHPTRIRVLELLQPGPMPVRDLLAELDLEASNLSQQLAVLRRVGLVTADRRGTTVLYSLASPHLKDLLVAGRRILAEMATVPEDVVAELRDSAG